ncbi:MAG: STAS domain-containing protein [Bacteroidia bacterium]
MHSQSETSGYDFFNRSCIQEKTMEQVYDRHEVKMIVYTNGAFQVEEEPIQLDGNYSVDKLPGVLCKGVQYVDLNNVGFVNNTGMAALIDLMKSLLKQGVDTQFVNVNQPIRKKINSLGLDQILKCL